MPGGKVGTIDSAMLDYRVLPDFLALTALVYVFWSILRRRAGEQLHAWLVGWIFVLAHFAFQLIGGHPGAVQTFFHCLSTLALEAAGAAFVYAVGGSDCSRRFRWIAGTGFFAIALYTVFLYLDVERHIVYYAAVGLLLGTAGAALTRDEEQSRGARNVYLAGVLLLAASLGLEVFAGRPEYGLDWILCAIYLVAGVQYWRKFPHRGTGVITAVSGFAAWALVFPVSLLLRVVAPQIQIENSAWNLPKYIVAIGVILTLLEEQMDQTEHLALHDPLTGLPNRRLLDDRLMKAIERGERNQSRVAVLLVDLDGFKQINDTYGHQVGDEVLRVVATRLQMRVRRADTIGRAGGDEFLIVVSDLLQARGAEVLVAKLLADLSEPIVVGDTQLRVRASIGVASYPDDAATAEALCAQADAAMYRRKRLSREGEGEEGQAATPGRPRKGSPKA